VLPTEEELRRYRRKLGDLLLEKKFITLTQLKQALEEQKKRQIPLGALLVQMGLVREDDLIHVLGQQLQLETQEIDPYRIPLEVIQALPRQLAVRYSLFPLEISDNKLVAATQNLLSPEELADIEGKIGKRLELRLATRSDLSFAIRMGYERLQPVPTGKLNAAVLAHLLLERQQVPVEVMAQALKMQRRSYVRLGDILVDQGVLSNESLQEAIKNYSQQPEMQLGDFLIQQQLLTEGQLQRALGGPGIHGRLVAVLWRGIEAGRSWTFRRLPGSASPGGWGAGSRNLPGGFGKLGGIAGQGPPLVR